MMALRSGRHLAPGLAGGKTVVLVREARPAQTPGHVGVCGQVAFRRGSRITARAPSSSTGRYGFISHTVFLKSFSKNQFRHTSVTSFFIRVIVKDKLTDLWGS